MQVVKIRKRQGIAGQYQLDATIKLENEESARTLGFVGSVYGGPVVMISDQGTQTFVSDPERFGSFGEDWVRRFLEA